MDFPILISWVSPRSILGASGVFFFIFISFFYEIHVNKQNFAASHLVLCPIKRTPGLCVWKGIGVIIQISIMPDSITCYGCL